MRLRKNVMATAALVLIALNVTVVFVGELPLFKASSALPNSSETIAFTDKAVSVLGVSTISELIDARLQRSTSKITSRLALHQLSTLRPERDILVIDGLWLKDVPFRNVADSLRPVILQGTPAIVLAGSSDILEAAIDDLQISYAHSDSPVIAHGLKYYSSTGASSSLEIAGILGQKGHFETALTMAYEWGVQYLSNSVPYPEPEHHSPWWNWRYTFTYYSGDFHKPYGRVNVVNDYYRLEEDGSSSYQWYNAIFRLQSVPGKSIWGNDYRTTDMKNRYTANGQPYGGHENDILNDYDPTTTSGATTVGVSVGTTAGTNGATQTSTQSWSYTISDVRVYDQSDFGLQRASWWHDVSETLNVGKYTYTVKPGETTRTPENGWYGIYDLYTVTWVAWIIDWWIFGHNDYQSGGPAVGGHVY